MLPQISDELNFIHPSCSEEKIIQSSFIVIPSYLSKENHFSACSSESASLQGTKLSFK